MPLDSNIISAASNFYKQRKELEDEYGDNDNEGNEGWTHANNIAMKSMEVKLEEMGWRRIDYGAYSFVYINPDKPYVLKINRVYDRGFARFVLITKKHPNKHFPNIGNMKLLTADGKKYYIYLMEPLESLHNSIFSRILVIFLKILCDNSYSNVRDCMNKAEFHIRRLYGVDYRWEIPKVYELFEQQPDLIEACRIIGMNVKGDLIDMHAGNIMKRGDGTIIIIDPMI
jgi:hypothetical protein